MTKLRHLSLLLLVFMFSSVSAQEDVFVGESCTSIMVGRDASADGSVITSHTCDGRYRTWVTIEPAADHPAGSLHAVYKGTAHTVSPEDTTGVRLVGEIPEVSHTFAYINTAYPSMNEHQLAIGETTFGGPDTLRNADGMFLIEELQRIALQRCSTAVDAVVLIGRLVEQYGYSDGGECITIADRNEIWQMEILGAGKNNRGGIWAAQRVPDNHVAVSANIPRIGLLRRDDTATFRCSDNIESVALNHGLWNGTDTFVFWRAFLPNYAEGRNFREREYFILNSVAPSLQLSFESPEMPFSVQPDRKVSVEDVMALFRSTYEGTDFDMCRNLTVPMQIKDSLGTVRTVDEISPIANPWMTSATQSLLNSMKPDAVTFRRTISVAWCSYSWVAQLRANQPDAVGGICWFSVDNPGQSPRIPIFCGTTSLPADFARCGQRNYDQDAIVWKFRRANKLATLAWQRTRNEMIDSVLTLQTYAFDGLSALENQVARLSDLTVVSDLLNGYTARIYQMSVTAWTALEASYWKRFGLGF